MLGFQMLYSTLMKTTEHSGLLNTTDEHNNEHNWSTGRVAEDLEPAFSSALITL